MNDTTQAPAASVAEVPASSPRHAPWISPAFVYAFATGVTMWILGFLTHIPGATAPAQVTGILLIGVQVAGALLLGRAASTPLRTGALAGFLTSFVNLFVLGALLTPPNPTPGADRSAILIALAYVVASTFAGAAGTFAGAMIFPPSPRLRARTTRDWLGRFALVAVCSAIPVLLSGAFVTTINAGLSVRDWPTTYGAFMWLYPVSRMTGGIYYEHAHRLFGTLVGLTTLTLLIFALIAEPRKWTKLLILGAFLLVCFQGVLGGYRVMAAQRTATTPTTLTAPAPDQDVPLNYSQTTDTEESTAIAMIHAIAAQITVAYLCIVGAVTGKRWRTVQIVTRPTDSFLRATALALVICLVVQITLGAATRHFQQISLMMIHLTFAFVVTLAAALAGFRTTRYGPEYKPLKLMGVHVFIFVAIQIVLGFLTMFAVLPTYHTPPEPDTTASLILATAHQAMGAALFAISSVLLLWTYRYTTGHKHAPAQQLATGDERLATSD